MDVFAKHQTKIAKDTMKMSEVGALIMGDMTKAEARAFLAPDCIIHSLFFDSDTPEFHRSEYCEKNCQYKCINGHAYKTR